LDKLDVTFVSKNGIFEYLPSAPELVSDKVKPKQISRDLRPLLRSLGVEFIRARVDELVPDSMEVVLEGDERLKYDYLAVCLGAEPWTPSEFPSNASTTYRIWDTMKFKESLERASDTVLNNRSAGEKVRRFLEKRGIKFLLERSEGNRGGPSCSRGWGKDRVFCGSLDGWSGSSGSHKCPLEEAQEGKVLSGRQLPEGS